VPHLPSIERWRKSDRKEAYDINRDATRQEMRSFVCGQCHVEYYCGPKVTLFFPWNKGLKVEQIEEHYDNFKFPDGHRFYDWTHAETGAEVLKAQHPEFELWSQGIHARSGVACADCHMPYERVGAMKVSDHWVRSPVLNIARACQTCHHYEEEEIKARIDAIQGRNHDLMRRAGAALTDMLDAVKPLKDRVKQSVPRPDGMNDADYKAAVDKAWAARVGTDADLQQVMALQRKGQWRLDFIAAENSMGFHAPQEAARVLGEAVDYLRQAQLAAQRATNAATTQPAGGK
jgi:nitrite reductase (cytochrome c-552)